jgi:two-component system chemotaxis response regulator CheB
MSFVANCSSPLRVLMVDESAIVMQLFARELSRHFDLQLVGTARETSEANHKFNELKPDVLTLDFEMSRLDAPSFLAQLMRSAPCPVIALVSPTEKGATLAMEALTAGASDVLFKPDSTRSIDQVIATLLEKIRAARGMKAIVPARRTTKPDIKPLASNPPAETILAIGTGCGGIAALDEVLSQLPANAPGTVVVHHLPARVTRLFAQRLSQLSNIEIKEAATGDHVIAGRVLIAPGGRHLLIRRSGSEYSVHIKDGPEVFHQKPSVDVLFNSVAKAAGENAIGAILHACASDGAQGLLNLRKAGAHTIVADEGIAYPAAERIVPLNQIASAMIEMAAQPKVYKNAQ